MVRPSGHVQAAAPRRARQSTDCSEVVGNDGQSHGLRCPNGTPSDRHVWKSALKSDKGLGELITALRSLASELGEYPRSDLFAPPLENLLRQTARDSEHTFSADAAWILSHCDEEF